VLFGEVVELYRVEGGLADEAGEGSDAAGGRAALFQYEAPLGGAVEGLQEVAYAAVVDTAAGVRVAAGAVGEDDGTGSAGRAPQGDGILEVAPHSSTPGSSRSARRTSRTRARGRRPCR